LPFREINLKDIIFDPKVQTYCVSPNYKCPSYGHSWACPPEAPYLEEEVSKFKEFYLVYCEIDLVNQVKKEKVKNPNLSESQIRTKLLTSSLLRDKMQEEIKFLLDKEHNKNKEKLILGSGYCRTCFNKKDGGCTYDSGKPCRYPNKKRYSMEAAGIHVTETIKNLGLNIEWPPINYVYQFGLVCLR
jgi:predicted metal-binding protein